MNTCQIRTGLLAAAFLACPLISSADEVHDVTVRAIHLCEWQVHSFLGRADLMPAFVPILQFQGAIPITLDDEGEANRVSATVMLSTLSPEYFSSQTGWKNTLDGWMKSNLLELRSNLKSDADWIKTHSAANNAETYNQHMFWLNEQKTRALVLKQSLLEGGRPYDCTILGLTSDDLEAALGFSVSELTDQSYKSWTIRGQKLNAFFGSADLSFYEFRPEAHMPVFSERMLKISLTLPD